MDVLTAELAVGQAPASEVVRAELVDSAEPIGPRTARRRVVLPVVLFLLTCASTFIAGATGWWPADYFDNLLALDSPYWLMPLRLAILENWQQGLLYTGCLLGILLVHEMGHFVMTVLYRVRASLPYFLPFPISPIGTMGAVIGMDGHSADRRQIFDIGLAGPIAGLIVAAPLVWMGTRELDLANTPPAGHRFGMPLAMRLLIEQMHPGEYKPKIGVAQNQLNAYFMAGWVGLLVTGLNMMPVSQLDGGHVTYALFGRRAHWIARIFMVLLFVYMGVYVWMYRQPPALFLMAVLILLMGTDHPPTRDDSVRLGWFRGLLGLASLAIPILCLVPNPILG
jgi:membrane-associated protease RseP (regulator of RpoE activity)